MLRHVDFSNPFLSNRIIESYSYPLPIPPKFLHIWASWYSKRLSDFSKVINLMVKNSGLELSFHPGIGGPSHTISPFLYMNLILFKFKGFIHSNLILIFHWWTWDKISMSSGKPILHSLAIFLYNCYYE